MQYHLGKQVRIAKNAFKDWNNLRTAQCYLNAPLSIDLSDVTLENEHYIDPIEIIVPRYV